MTCGSAGLAEFEVSGPLALTALTGLVARIQLIPFLVRLPAVHPVRFVQLAHPVAAYSRCLARRPAQSALAAPVDSVVGWVVAGSEVSLGALRAFWSQIHS